MISVATQMIECRKNNNENHKHVQKHLYLLTYRVLANKIVFDQNTPETRARFVSQVTPLLSLIQTQQGIDQFSVVMDESNNTVEDVEQNRLNGRIVLVPTRAVEFIAIDFIITSAGVSFD